MRAGSLYRKAGCSSISMNLKEYGTEHLTVEVVEWIDMYNFFFSPNSGLTSREEIDGV